METVIRLFQKDGIFSKTATILVVVWSVAIFKWIFQGLTLTIPKIGLIWTVIFTGGDALAMTGAASSLYFLVHNVTNLRTAPPSTGGEGERG